MRRLLLIIDPQVDFITGTLPVPGAEKAMDSLADYITVNSDTYTEIVITADRHPADHFSFAPQGGEWPVHCVHDSVGAAIWPRLYDAALVTGCPVTVLHKGERPDVEEYSIFQNTYSCAALAGIVERRGITHIDICGLAGDVCVLSSLGDGLRVLPGIRFGVLARYSPSLDGGKALETFITENLKQA